MTTLGLAFLAVKAVEYGMEYADGLLPALSDPTRFSSPFEHLFMNLYFVATALHAFHVTLGVLMLAAMAILTRRRRQRFPGGTMPIELAGLYWHLVDVIWIFLYPVLYLAR